MWFQPTLPRGERRDAPGARHSALGFNPRSRAGSDLVPCDDCRGHGYVSTHAPARGATTASAEVIAAIAFQPTLPRGERHHDGVARHDRTLVSTHAPARGATLLGMGVLPTVAVSTHAPARGATRA